MSDGLGRFSCPNLDELNFSYYLFDDGAEGLSWLRSSGPKLLLPRVPDEHRPLQSSELQMDLRASISSARQQQDDGTTSNRIAGKRRATWPSLHRPYVEVSILLLPARDCPGLRHAFSVATLRRLEPLGRRRPQHLPVRVIATSGASWLVACQVRHPVT